MSAETELENSSSTSTANEAETPIEPALESAIDYAETSSSEFRKTETAVDDELVKMEPVSLEENSNVSRSSCQSPASEFDQSANQSQDSEINLSITDDTVKNGDRSSDSLDTMDGKMNGVDNELHDSDSMSSKENTDNSNVPNDDVIFVKPKDKDRGHCYW